MTARYLLRFDDVCPTMNWSVWNQVEQALFDLCIKPIVAVVPDNQDPKLKVAEPNRNFWNRVREWQQRGWAIGMHGYQHLPLTQSGGILKLNRWSEFSGLPPGDQRSKLQCAFDLFEQHGVRPDLWIAPAHSFDATTLQALLNIGIRYLSDGFSFYPYRDSNEMLWVPQQLWHFRKMRFGLWTVCIHVNRWDASDVDHFRSNLQTFRVVLTDWNSVISLYDRRTKSTLDRIFSMTYPAYMKSRRWLSKKSAP